MNSTLQDIMGLLKRYAVKTPTDADYMVIAGHSSRGVLVPQPGLEPNVITIGGLKDHVLKYATLQQVVDTGNTIQLATTKAKGIDIILTDLATVYQNGVSVTIPVQTGSPYPPFFPAPDAFIANINGQTPGTLIGSVVGFLANVAGEDNIAFSVDLTTTSGSSRGFDAASFDAHTGDYFRARKQITGIETIPFKVANNGDTTANKFIKIGGTSTQFLMGDGSVTIGKGGVYSYEIHVAQTDGSDITGTGTLLNPFATITHALTFVAGQRKTIIIHPGTYTENPSITVQYTVLVAAGTSGVIGGNVLISGTVSTSTGCTISGLKITNVNITTPTGTGNVNILNCDITGTLTKSSSADYTLIRFCDIGNPLTGTGGLNITSTAGTVAVFGGNPNFITVNNAGARVLVKNCTTIATVLILGNLSFADCIIISPTATSNAITTSPTTFLTLANSQIITPTSPTNVARILCNGFYSILNCVFDKQNSTLIGLSGTGGSTSSIVYSQFINADKFIKQGGTSTQFLMGDGSTSTMPTLQQVVTAGNVVEDSTIILDNDYPVTKQALVIGGNQAPAAGLLGIAATEGTCIKADSGDGVTIVASNTDGIAVKAITGNDIAIYTQSLGLDGTALLVNGVARGITVNNGGIKIQGVVHDDTSYQLSLSANSAAKPSTNTWTIVSDSRVKTNINPYTKGLEAILAINPITYDYNGKAGFDPTNVGNIGVIAQDVLNIIPEAINIYHAILNEEDKEKTELYNFDSHALTFILINAVKQLSAEIELLKTQLT